MIGHKNFTGVAVHDRGRRYCYSAANIVMRRRRYRHRLPSRMFPSLTPSKSRCFLHRPWSLRAIGFKPSALLCQSRKARRSLMAKGSS